MCCQWTSGDGTRQSREATVGYCRLESDVQSARPPIQPDSETRHLHLLHACCRCIECRRFSESTRAARVSEGPGERTTIGSDGSYGSGTRAHLLQSSSRAFEHFLSLLVRAQSTRSLVGWPRFHFPLPLSCRLCQNMRNELCRPALAN